MPGNSETAARPRELKIAIAYGPECPHCRETGFDDWWHDKGVRERGDLLTGSLKCHGCGKFFSVTQYQGGQTHSTAWRKSAMPGDQSAVARIAGTLDRLASLVERMADTHPQRHEAREIAIEARKLVREVMAKASRHTPVAAILDDPQADVPLTADQESGLLRWYTDPALGADALSIRRVDGSVTQLVHPLQKTPSSI